jgi:hypothetical protein
MTLSGSWSRSSRDRWSIKHGWLASFRKAGNVEALQLAKLWGKLKQRVPHRVSQRQEPHLGYLTASWLPPHLITDVTSFHAKTELQATPIVWPSTWHRGLTTQNRSSRTLFHQLHSRSRISHLWACDHAVLPFDVFLLRRSICTTDTSVKLFRHLHLVQYTLLSPPGSPQGPYNQHRAR